MCCEYYTAGYVVGAQQMVDPQLSTSLMCDFIFHRREVLEGQI